MTVVHTNGGAGTQSFGVGFLLILLYFSTDERGGALVFDVADLIKDTIVLPWAFICAKEKATEQEFRQQVLQKITAHGALDQDMVNR